MMTRRRLFLATLLLGVQCIAQDDAPVRIQALTGKLMVSFPGSDVVLPGQPGQSYPVGTRFQLDADCKAEIQVAPGVVGSFSAGADFSVAAGQPGEARTVNLTAGAAEMTVAPDSDQRINIQLPGGIAAPNGGSVMRCQVQSEQGEQLVDVTMVRGTGSLQGPTFRVSDMSEGAALGLRATPDDLIVVVNAGEVSVTMLGSNGEEITRRVSAGGMLMTGGQDGQDSGNAAFLAIVGADGKEEVMEVVRIPAGLALAMVSGVSARNEMTRETRFSAPTDLQMSTLLQSPALISPVFPLYQGQAGPEAQNP